MPFLWLGSSFSGQAAWTTKETICPCSQAGLKDFNEKEQKTNGAPVVCLVGSPWCCASTRGRLFPAVMEDIASV